MKLNRGKLLLGAGTVALSMMSAGFAAPAYAQDSGQSTKADDDSKSTDIVITGSILSRTDTETPSPVTVLSADTLDKRGINTVADAVQRLSANGAGTITQGWNTGYNFATGANAASLRGLTVQSTLTIFDGLRMSPYPLADDGHRNFVDLNTIPEGIIDRIEVLRDGASSTYGADAVAGVINIITKKQIQGIHLDGSAGISGKGDAGEQRISITAGYGDLDSQGFNVYIAGEYQHSDPLYARDRGYPFNTADLSKICDGAGHCLTNGITNGISADGSFNGLGTTIVPVVAPYNASGTSRLGPYQLLNPAAGCGILTPVTLTPAQTGGGAYDTAQCQQDLRQMYNELLPEQERLGFSGRVTARLGDNAEVYAAVNYYQVKTQTFGTPLTFAGQTTPPNGVVYSPVFLPVYVCSAGTLTLPNSTDNGCNAGNGVLNPNNPFAASGQLARLLYRYDLPRQIDTKSRALRGALGVNGSFGDDWKYDVSLVASNTQLTYTQHNYLVPQRLADVIADGSYNFLDPSANSQAIRDYIAPVNVTRSESNLWQVQATLAKGLLELPGGTLQAAVGVAYRHESIDNPSANAANDTDPYSRYYGVNSVGAVGSRNVKSAFYEINIPLFDQFEIDTSGRYDDYSSGQSNFSPKVGIKFKPVDMLLVRATFSKGFRIPSFNEAYGLPTTGYVTYQVASGDPGATAFYQAHSPTGNKDDANAYATGQYSVGLTATGNPSLDPEKSTSYTAGIVFEPMRNVSFTVDYWHIKVKDLIGGADYSQVADQYYANNGVVNIPGITVRPQLADPAFPNALPLLGFIEYSFQNADSEVVSGIDLGMNARFNLGGGIIWTTNAEASYLIKYEKTFDSGAVQRYDGTLSPCDITSCSGAPKWRANWQNTFEINDFTISGTLYYTSGYDLASTDYGGVKGDCANNIGGSVVAYKGTSIPVLCEGPATWNFDLTTSYKVNDKFTIYANVLNLFDIDAPFDPSAAYSIFQFNPAWAGQNIMGRYFRVGAKVDF